MHNKIQIFEKHPIRAFWDEDAEKWWFSVVDICAVLSEQSTQRGATFYWGTLKKRLKTEGSELLTNCQQLKMLEDRCNTKEKKVNEKFEGLNFCITFAGQY